MKTKMILAVLALALSPSIAAACMKGEHKQAASCQAGATWDMATGACVVNPTG